MATDLPEKSSNILNLGAKIGWENVLSLLPVAVYICDMEGRIHSLTRARRSFGVVGQNLITGKINTAAQLAQCMLMTYH